MTVTSRPRLRSEAATSSPMKLDPITTQFRACCALAMMALLSARVRRRRTWGRFEPLIESERGSAPVASRSAP